MSETAYIDGYALPFNPNSVSWSYTINTSSTDTLGGRVVQILSATIRTGSWQAEAGSRKRLTDLYDKIAEIMGKQVRTKRPVRLEVPSRQYAFDVYLRSFPALSWNARSVKYEYQFSFEIDQDLGALIS